MIRATRSQPRQRFRIRRIHKSQHFGQIIKVSDQTLLARHTPPNQRKKIERNLTMILQGLGSNAAKYALLQRRDMHIQDASLTDKLQRQGMLVNKADTASMKARLGPYYARWKAEFGPTVWNLLAQSARV